MKLLRNIFIFFFIFLVLLGSAAGYWIYQNFRYQNPHSVAIEIEKGESLKKIAETLAKNQVIQNKYFFEIHLRVTKQAAKIKYGEYNFPQNARFHDVVEKLLKGEFVQHYFTIPEGYNLKQIKQVLVDDKKLMTDDEYQKQILRVELLQGVKKAENLEGFLFPDTYSYTKRTTPSQIIKMMVKNFYKKIPSEWIEKAKEQGFSLYELVTFASLVEKETGVPHERPLIAGVFHNRLQKGMLLQTDPAVIYGIQNYDGNIRRSDLRRDTPYNTYTRPGLPKGPIASVGIDAIKAVVFPTKTAYFYFVAKGEGAHYFSQTLRQHNNAVNYYQLKRGSEPEPVKDE